MKYFDPYKNRPKDSSYYRILEVLWKSNLLKIDESEEGTEYEYIALSIIEKKQEINFNNCNFTYFIKSQFNFWCGYKIPCKKASDFISLSNDIKKILE